MRKYEPNSVLTAFASFFEQSIPAHRGCTTSTQTHFDSMQMRALELLRYANPFPREGWPRGDKQRDSVVSNTGRQKLH